MLVTMSECLQYQCQVAMRLSNVFERIRAFRRIIIIILLKRYYRLPARHDIIIIKILRFCIICLADRSRRGPSLRRRFPHSHRRPSVCIRATRSGDIHLIRRRRRLLDGYSARLHTRPRAKIILL